MYRGDKDIKSKKDTHSDLRDCVLSEGQILDQNIQTSILLIQKLPDPPTERHRQSQSQSIRDTDRWSETQAGVQRDRKVSR